MNLFITFIGVTFLCVIGWCVGRYFGKRDADRIMKNLKKTLNLGYSL